MRSLTCRGFAKINLTLDILGRREDGYHLLQMAMQSVSLFDTVRLTRSAAPGVSLVCADPAVPRDGSDTASRAARAFLSAAGLAEGVCVELEKAIPSQAGLGGASADAAAVLHGMNALFDARLSPQTLLRLGLSVGADVPFCLTGGTLLAEGVGERLSPLPAPPPCWVVLCKPEAGVSTREAFRLADEGRSGYAPHTPGMRRALEAGRLPEVAAALGNHFEALLPLPPVREAKRLLREGGAENACMTGSGSAVFGLFAQEETARRCAEALAPLFPFTAVCEPAAQGVAVETSC